MVTAGHVHEGVNDSVCDRLHRPSNGRRPCGTAAVKNDQNEKKKIPNKILSSSSPLNEITRYFIIINKIILTRHDPCRYACSLGFLVDGSPRIVSADAIR